MNRLKFETSPYLLQHAHNPVHWMAWKAEAFAKAQMEDKPLLVSVGYSTCHWCHVMERESFEDQEVAAFMNAHFVNIKVDREERPDVDHFLMEACLAVSGSGGWPLNCFLTPDGRPFYAGTYFPPGPAYNRPSWMQALTYLAGIFRDDRAKVEDQANRLTQMIKNSEKAFLDLSPPLGPQFSQAISPVTIHSIYHTLRQNFDTEHGGFGGAPKFPGTLSLQFLLEYYFFTGDQDALNHVRFSLSRMIRGGIYDQLGGGFARYATDRAWLVPHFEKMLYDNALLVALLADTCKATSDPEFASALRETLEFVQRELTSIDGGFFTALDADSEGEEGKYYVWSHEEIHRLLGEEAHLFCACYGILPEGNWEGENILWRPCALEECARQNGLELQDLAARLESCRKTLFKHRQQRIRPGLDQKFLLDWNALMCTAYARAYAALDEPSYRDAAERNITFLLSRLKKPDGQGFFHTYSATSDGGRAQYEAFLDDYANLIEALFEVYSITFNPYYLRHADGLLQFVLDRFLDRDANLFYFTSSDQQDLALRKKELNDGVTPSGNAVMARNLHKAALILGRKDYADLAHQMLHRMKESTERYPGSFSCWANTMLYLAYPFHEVAVCGPEAGQAGKEINSAFLPNKILMAAEQPTLEFPVLAGRGFRNQTQIYICKDFSCQLPLQRTGEAIAQLRQPWPAHSEAGGK